MHYFFLIKHMDYRNIFKLALLLVMAVLSGSCKSRNSEMNPRQYEEYIREWDYDRLQSLKSPDGWVNLAGLFWLSEGENSVGSAGRNDIVFPAGPGTIGVLTLSGDEVSFRPSPGPDIYADGTPLSGSISIFGENPHAELITVDSIGFFIIKRGDRTAVRLRNYNHPRLKSIQFIDRYPPDQQWIMESRFIESEQGLTMMVTDVLGETVQEVVPGIIEFEYQGKTRRLYPTGSIDRLFIVFADDTNGTETYGGGRFLLAGSPDEKGMLNIDFNKAYNPPCAFSPHTTCPLPPRENSLPFRVEAGEKTVRPDTTYMPGPG
jgi:uncharacterized protein